ncbi:MULTISPECIES: hypothetical protein [unclassified Streptomyces]|uniref:hypothetical protein n=1 Tax=unclassified Streptomyces TaxID=2593676 RepID=UPI0004CB3C0C|nr:hypothetical protein [Streptomyces sp. NRRL F-2747]
METVTSTRPTRPGKDTEDLTLTPLPSWQSIAELVLRKDACGALCAHGCFTGASSVPARRHR